MKQISYFIFQAQSVKMEFAIDYVQRNFSHTDAPGFLYFQESADVEYKPIITTVPLVKTITAIRETNLTAGLLSGKIESPHNDILLPTIIFGIIVIFTGCMSNMLIIKSCLNIRRRNSYKATLFITSLAVNDLLCLVLMVCYMVYMLVPNVQKRLVNNILTSSHVLLSCNSQFHNAVISLERAIAVYFPVRHRVLITTRKAKNCIFGLWICSCILFMVALLRQNINTPGYDQAVFWLCIVLAFPLPVSIVLVSYCFIAIVSCRNVKANASRSSQENLCQRNRHLSNELKIVLNISIMVLPMAACWSVFFVGTIYETVTDKRMDMWVDWTLTFLPFFASAVNPILYMIGTRSLKTKFKRRNTAHYFRRTLNRSNETYI